MSLLIIEVIKIVVWPGFALFSIYLLRKPLSEMINGITDFNIGGKHGLSARVGKSKPYTKEESKVEIESNLPNMEYFTKEQTGKVTFNYSNNNGVYTIGEGEYRFDTMWTKASNESIHFYNDKPTIKTVRLVKDIADIKKVNPEKYDSSSRARTVNVGQIAVYENIHNKFLIIKIIDIKDDSRGDENDELTFEYQIIS